ncbi:hypothetical protein M1545_03610 [Patescibacteria group bacterium]|nr:hypothetical protein [Patescibacteria group bacterium]
MPTLEVLEGQGLEERDLYVIRSNPEGAKRLVRFIHEGWIHQRKYIFNPDLWLTTYAPLNVEFSEEEFSRIKKFPWDIGILEEPDPWESDRLIWQTHIAFYMPQKFSVLPSTELEMLNIRKLHRLPRRQEYPDILPATWQEEYQFTGKVAGGRWYLMRIGPVPGSQGSGETKYSGLPYNEMLKLLPDSYEVPYAVERIVGNLAAFHLNGDFLDQVRVFCQDIGGYDLERMTVYAYQESFKVPKIGCLGERWDQASRYNGLAASRKLPKG